MKKIVLADFCIFFFSFSALTCLVFFAGNFQGFTGRTQMLLLDILKYSALFSALSGAGFFAFLCVGIFRKTGAVRPRDFFLAAAACVFGAGALFGAQFIIAVTLPKL